MTSTVWSWLKRALFTVFCLLTLCALVVYFSAGLFAERICFAYLELAQARAASCQLQASYSRPYTLTDIFQLSEKSLRRVKIVLTGIRYDSSNLAFQSEGGNVSLDLLKVGQALFSQKQSGFELGLLDAVSEIQLVNASVLPAKENSLVQELEWRGFFQLKVARRLEIEPKTELKSEPDAREESAAVNDFAVWLDLTELQLQRRVPQVSSHSDSVDALRAIKTRGESLFIKGLVSFKNLSELFSKQASQERKPALEFELNNGTFGDVLNFSVRYDSSQKLADLFFEPVELSLLERFFAVPPALHGLRIGAKARLSLESVENVNAVSLEAQATSVNGYVDGKELRRLLEPKIARAVFSQLEPALLREGLNLALSLPGPEQSKTVATLKHFGLKPDIIQGSGNEARIDLAQVIPDKIEIQKGEARIAAAWKAGLLANHESQILLQSNGLALQEWHATTESENTATARSARGELRLSLNSAGSLKVTDDFYVSLDLAVRAPEFKPEVSVSEAERNRLFAKFSQVKLPLGLGGDNPVKITIPSSNELSSIEKAGKEWLRGLIKKNESDDSHSKEEATRKMKDSEKILKEALGKLLGK